ARCGAFPAIVAWRGGSQHGNLRVGDRGRGGRALYSKPGRRQGVGRSPGLEYQSPATLSAIIVEIERDSRKLAPAVKSTHRSSPDGQAGIAVGRRNRPR